MPQSSSMLLALATAAGLLTHELYLNQGEHHLKGAGYLKLAYFSWITGIALYHRFDVTDNQTSWPAAIYNSTKVHAFYLLGIYTSLLVYRLFLNPLNKFPGPFSHRISALCFSWRVRKGDCHVQLADLHSRYGRFVRVGPNSISVTVADAVEILQGPNSKSSKGEIYDMTFPVKSLQTLRGKADHARRRRIWSPAFSDRALRGYDKRIQVLQDFLVSNISATKGEAVNIRHLLQLYSFDVMGDLAFGESYGMIESLQKHWAIKLVEDGLKPVTLMLPMWIFHLAMAIPGLSKDWDQYVGYCRQKLVERMQTTPEIPDIMSSLLAPHKDNKPSEKEMNLLVGDSQALIAAGGDTTAAAMTAILYYLCKDPNQLDKLRQELLPLWAEKPSSANGIAVEKLATLKHLNAVINEALRLLPPVPTTMIRTSPPEGVTIAKTYIPGNVDIWIPPYPLGRDESIYAEANSFIPERWYSSPELVKDSRAFAPFNIGPYNCIGKPLALMNIRSVISKLVCHFDFTFAPGEDGSRLEGEAFDGFLLGLGPLNMSFKPRSAYLDWDLTMSVGVVQR